MGGRAAIGTNYGGVSLLEGHAAFNAHGLVLPGDTRSLSGMLTTTSLITTPYRRVRPRIEISEVVLFRPCRSHLVARHLEADLSSNNCVATNVVILLTTRNSERGSINFLKVPLTEL